MNDQKIQLECRIQINGGLANTDIYQLTHELNRNIFSAFDYRQPIEMLKNKLEKKHITNQLSGK